MMGIASAVTAISTLASIAGIWVMLGLLYRDYRVDVFRNNLFMLRAELFDLARAGVIAFDDPAYTALRTRLNGFLRFAHRISLLFAILALLGAGDNEQVAELTEEETRRFDQLPANVRANLINIRDRMRIEVVRQLLLSSPLLTLAIVPYAVVSMLQFLAQRLVWRFVTTSIRRCHQWVRDIVAPLDDVALRIGASH